MENNMENNESMTTTAAKMMLDAMKRLTAKEITPQEAQGVAVLGKGVIDAANAEIAFIKTVKAMPCKGGIFGKNVLMLEPDVSEDAEEEFNRRIALEKSSFLEPLPKDRKKKKSCELEWHSEDGSGRV